MEENYTEMAIGVESLFWNDLGDDTTETDTQD